MKPMRILLNGIRVLCGIKTVYQGVGHAANGPHPQLPRRRRAARSGQALSLERGRELFPLIGRVWGNHCSDCYVGLRPFKGAKRRPRNDGKLGFRRSKAQNAPPSQ